jgi:hypothetical protein
VAIYSTRVITRNVEAYEKKSKNKLLRFSNGIRDEWRAHLEKRLLTFGNDRPLLEKNLTREELTFIRNERVLSMLDFSYWKHYAMIQQDGGGICNFDHPWESTNLLLKKIAAIQEQQYEAVWRGEMTPIVIPGQPKPAVPGILIANNKARQLAATTLGRLITMHRVTLQSQRRALAASVDDEKVQELYDRDKICYENLPFYVKPDLLYDEKRAHIHFNKLNSRVLYQVSTQKSGIGTGRNIVLHHTTEMSTWLNPQSVELDFYPAIPRSIHTFGHAESNPYGRGNWWHDWTERVRKGKFERWNYAFVPWYAEISKYRALAPDSWQPSEVSLLHAQLVHDSSPQWVGHTVMLPRENLYWWEMTRQAYKDGGRLNFFYTSYPATPEESFQHSTISAFKPDLLEALRMSARPGQTYEIMSA